MDNKCRESGTNDPKLFKATLNNDNIDLNQNWNVKNYG